MLPEETRDEMLALMRSRGLTQREVAAALGHRHWYVNHVLHGRAPEPPDFPRRWREAVEAAGVQKALRALGKQQPSAQS